MTMNHSKDLRPTLIFKCFMYFLLMCFGYGILKLLIYSNVTASFTIIFTLLYLGILVSMFIPEILFLAIAKWVEKKNMKYPRIFFFDFSPQNKREFNELIEDTKDNPTIR